MPQSEVHLKIPTDSIKQLPSGASFTARSGQADVKVSYKAGSSAAADTIVIDATCDSLLLQCAQYERRIVSLNHRLQSQQTELEVSQELLKEHESLGTRNKLLCVLIGFFLGFILTVVVFIIIKVKC